MSVRVVTFTTDFGVRDPFVGLMKLQVLARCPDARIVDLTHAVPAFRPEAAAFWMERVHRWSPDGSVHVAVVDPGVGTERRLLAAEAHGQRFLAPDNGLLASMLAATSDALVHAIDASCAVRYGLGERSATFHGRDVLAPLAAELAAGRAQVADLGPRIEDWQAVGPSCVRSGPDGGVAPDIAAVEPAVPAGAGTHAGVVVWIDHYGNAFTSLPSGLLRGLGAPTLRVAGRRIPVVRTYGEAPPGSVVAVANSFDVIEVAVVEGSAAHALGLDVGTTVELSPGGR